MEKRKNTGFQFFVKHYMKHLVIMVNLCTGTFNFYHGAVGAAVEFNMIQLLLMLIDLPENVWKIGPSVIFIITFINNI